MKQMKFLLCAHTIEHTASKSHHLSIIVIPLATLPNITVTCVVIRQHHQLSIVSGQRFSLRFPLFEWSFIQVG